MSVSRWEIVAVLVTGLGNVVVADGLQYRLAYILTACLLWSAYVLVRTVGDRAVLAEWGFTTRNFGRSLAVLAPLAAAATVAQIVYGVLSGKALWHWHIGLILVLYPLWGLVQQFLVVGLVAGNLRRWGRISDVAIVAVTAALFAAVHVASPVLVVAAFVLAVVTTTVYFRDGNLWALGLFHGWFATGLYYLVLGQDPWQRVVAAGLWR